MGGRYIEFIFQYLKGPGHRNASSAYNSESTTVTRALCPSSCSFLPCNGLPTNIYLPQWKEWCANLRTRICQTTPFPSDESEGVNCSSKARKLITSLRIDNRTKRLLLLIASIFLNPILTSDGSGKGEPYHSFPCIDWRKRRPVPAWPYLQSAFFNLPSRLLPFTWFLRAFVHT